MMIYCLGYNYTRIFDINNDSIFEIVFIIFYNLYCIYMEYIEYEGKSLGRDQRKAEYGRKNIDRDKNRRGKNQCRQKFQYMR